MSQEADASSFNAATEVDNASLLVRVANVWRNLAGTLIESSSRRVAHKTANYTVLAAESGKLFTNLGATATLTFTLPAAVLGLHYQFAVRASSGTSWQLRVTAAGSDTLETTAVPRVAQAAGTYLWADAIGEDLHLVCIETGKWAVLRSSGTWTAV